MRKIKIYILDKFAISKDIDADMFITYLGLRQIIRLEYDSHFVSLGMLSFYLSGKQNASQSITTAILSGINKLVDSDYKYISYTEDKKSMRRNDWSLDLSKLQIDSKTNAEFYTCIESEYIRKIINSTLKEKIELVRFYCYLMTTIAKTGFKTGVGFTSYEDLATNYGITRQTVSSYIDNLETMSIIYVYRSTDAIKHDDGSIKEITSAYGDIIDRAKIISVAQEHENTYGINAKLIQSKRQSSTRSASAKYNIIINDLRTTGEIRYSYDEMKQIYDTLVMYNEKYKNDTSGKLLKDLSIFANYDFYTKL